MARIFLLVSLFFVLNPRSFTQCLQGNCNNGSGTYVYPSGARYSGEFVNTKIHGKGTLWMSNGNIYTGEWVQNYREGRGKMVFKNGDTYTGEFLRSKLHGTGTMQYSLGGQYSGEWKSDLPDGKGKYTYANGETYEGLLTEGRRNGYGRYHYSDGSVYDGQWRDNLREGQGSLLLANGKKTSGNWSGDRLLAEGESLAASQENLPENVNANAALPTLSTPNLQNCNEIRCMYGLGFYIYKDGSKYVGPFRDGNPYGRGIVYYANGDRYEGQWDDTAPQGEGIMYFRSGKVFAAVWDRGRPVRQLENRPAIRPRTDIRPETDEEVRVWAVIVGVARYAHMPVLKYADDDAYQIYAFLKSPEGGAISDHQIKVLIDEDASRQKIIDALQEQFGKADANDVVMLYYSGHGVNGAFLPIDYDGYNNKLFHEEINQIMEESEAKHKLCMIDACYAGSMADAKADFSASLNKFYSILEAEKGGAAFILSCKNREVSLEDSGLRQGIFSHYLIRGLKGEADGDRNKIVSVQELFNYISQEVKTYTGNIQNPVMEGNYNPNMPVAILR
ncbi:MAG TPA: caspase family protein [Saprospiraceae bacterium]|nr:caspase family protein [Saprospiraceae bacterium]HNT18792.1 caspase family protein [Saprospiraceae bacterium]